MIDAETSFTEEARDACEGRPAAELQEMLAHWREKYRIEGPTWRNACYCVAIREALDKLGALGRKEIDIRH